MERPPHDQELYDMVNRTWARVSALERLVCEVVGATWTPERVEIWADRLTTLNDAVETPTERGRSDLQHAFDELAKRLLHESRRAHGR